MAVQTLPQPLRLVAHGAAASGYLEVERRRHARSRITGPRAPVVNIDAKNAGLLVNLGEGGMRVQALGRPLQAGATLSLQFQLPGSPDPLHASGVVAWVNNSAEAGIRFGEISESLARRLREWIAKNEIFNAAREFLRVAGGWQAALDLMTELIRMLISARGVAITLALPPRPRQATPAFGTDPEARPFFSSVAKEQPIRATVAAPIYDGERIIGHLEISSTELGAFDEQDLGALPVLAAMVGEMVHLRRAELQEAAHKPPPQPSATARIVNRIEAMFPKTVRVRLVF